MLDNALKYTPSEALISVSVQKESNSRFLVTIEDNGDGVDESDLDKLVQPFYRSQQVTAMPPEEYKGGFGLGMSIVAKSVKKMGGELTLEKSLQGGLSVTMALPIGA